VNDNSPARQYFPEACAKALTELEGTALVDAVCNHLLAAQARLARERSVGDILDAFDRVASHWLARLDAKDSLISEIAAYTGLSPEMVDLCIRAEQTSSGAADAGEALDAELGDRRTLDGFVWQPQFKRHVRAIGPRLTLGILPGNIPGLSHLPMMRALLVKSSFLGKSAGGEPFYAAAYARSLASIDPLLGECIAVLDWRREEEQLLESALAHADAVIAYGSAESVDAIAARVRPTQRFSAHGHKVGVAVVVANEVETRLDEVCEALALDVAMYDQQACLAPQHLLIVGNDTQSERVANSLGASLARFHERVPRATPDLEQAASLRAWSDGIEWSGGRIWGRGPWGIVAETVAAHPLSPTPGFRSAQLTVVADLESAVAAVQGWQPWLQNAAIAASASTFAELAEKLAQLGCSRVTQVGAMPFPSFRWHHDGRPCIADLVRFCDIEATAENPLLSPIFDQVGSSGEPGGDT
jgi:hypothetical protein